MSQYKKDIYSNLSKYTLKTLGKLVIPPTPPCSPVYVIPITPVFLLPETIKTIDIPYDNKPKETIEHKVNIEPKVNTEPKVNIEANLIEQPNIILEKQRTSFDLCRIF